MAPRHKEDAMCNEINDKNSIRGVIAARKCKCCGHHEIIVVKENGEAVPLRSGMKIIGYLVPGKEEGDE